jgi:hypothetical protein
MGLGKEFPRRSPGARKSIELPKKATSYLKKISG